MLRSLFCIAIVFLFSCASYANELTNKQKREIAKSYVEAFTEGNYEEFKALFSDSTKIEKNDFLEYRKLVRKMKFLGSSDDHLRLKLDLNSGYAFNIHLLGHLGNPTERWLLLNPSGKIKYDSILLKHPIEVGFQNTSIIETLRGQRFKGIALNENIKNKHLELAKVSVLNLQTAKINLFNLDVNNDPNEVSGEIKKIKNWLHDNWDSWDISEPKTAFPKKLYKTYYKND